MINQSFRLSDAYLWAIRIKLPEIGNRMDGHQECQKCTKRERNELFLPHKKNNHLQCLRVYRAFGLRLCTSVRSYGNDMDNTSASLSFSLSMFVLLTIFWFKLVLRVWVWLVGCSFVAAAAAAACRNLLSKAKVNKRKREGKPLTAKLEHSRVSFVLYMIG